MEEETARDLPPPRTPPFRHISLLSRNVKFIWERRGWIKEVHFVHFHLILVLLDNVAMSVWGHGHRGGFEVIRIWIFVIWERFNRDRETAFRISIRAQGAWNWGSFQLFLPYRSVDHVYGRESSLNFLVTHCHWTQVTGTHVVNSSQIRILH